MKYRIAIVLIFLAALTRLLPHPVNFTAVGAIGLFGASQLNRRWLAMLVPFAALFLSDLFINNVMYAEYFGKFQWFYSGWIYLAFALVMLSGFLILRDKVNIGRVVGASLTASVIFFLVTNFSSWLEMGIYPKTPAGLFSCYVAGIPFFGNTMLGDLFYSGIMFGSYAFAVRRLGSPVKA